MKDEIKEKIIKEIEKMKSESLNSEEKYALYCMRYFELKAKLQQHEETSKAKDEEELRFLFEMNSRYKLFNGNIFMNEMVKKRIEEIKQKIKEKEE